MKFLFLSFYNFIENQIYLKKIKKFLDKNIFLNKPTIFDVGSHQGKMTSLFKSIYNDSKIFCFDPNKDFNLKVKKIDKNIKIYNFAFGNKIEKKKLFLNNIDLTNSLAEINEGSIYLKIKNFIVKKPKKKFFKKIKVFTLNNFCKQNKIKKIDLLKIDVEGYEYMVLLGAKDFLKNVDYIMLEIQQNNMYKNYSSIKIENFLKKNNFKLIKIFKFPLMFFQDRIYKKV